MKKTILLLCFLLVTATYLTAQTQRNNHENEKVEQAVIKFFDGIAALDATIIRQHSTKDLMILEDGAIWNFDTLTTKLEPLKAVSFSRINQFKFIETVVAGNSAWVAYKNTADMTIDGQKVNKQWLESAFLVKEDNKWQIKLLHSTVLKPRTS